MKISLEIIELLNELISFVENKNSNVKMNNQTGKLFLELIIQTSYTHNTI